MHIHLPRHRILLAQLPTRTLYDYDPLFPRILVQLVEVGLLDDDQGLVHRKVSVYLVVHNHVVVHVEVRAVVHEAGREEDHEVDREAGHVVDHEGDQEDLVDVDQDVGEVVLAGRMLDSHEVLDHPAVPEEVLAVDHHGLEVALLDHP